MLAGLQLKTTPRESLFQQFQPKGVTVSYALEQGSQPSLATCISGNVQQGDLTEPCLRDT